MKRRIEYWMEYSDVQRFLSTPVGETVDLPIREMEIFRTFGRIKLQAGCPEGRKRIRGSSIRTTEWYLPIQVKPDETKPKKTKPKKTKPSQD